MNAKNWHRTLNWALVCLLLLIAVWMAYETGRGAPAHYGLYRNTSRETIIIHPSRAVVAYYLFLITLSLFPAIWLFRAADTGGRRLPRILGFAGLALSSAMAGFAYETLQAEIQLTLLNLGYRSSGSTVQIPWSQIQAMAVRSHSRSQWIEVLGVRDIVRIDLGPFALPDKRMLVAELPRIADLRSGPRKLPDGWVWRRSTGITLPQ